MEHLKGEIKKHIIQVMFLILILSIIVIILEKTNKSLFVSAPLELKEFFNGFGKFAIPFYILIYVVANVFLTPSFPFIFCAGIIFGFPIGFFVALLGETLSATIDYFFGKKLMRLLFRKSHSHGRKVRFVKKYIERHGFFLIFILRYLGFYFDIVSYAAGLTKVKYKPYILATLIGFMPFVFIYSYSGASLINIKSSSFVYYILLFKILLFGIFISIFLSYKLIRRKLHESNNNKK